MNFYVEIKKDMRIFSKCACENLDKNHFADAAMDFS